MTITVAIVEGAVTSELRRSVLRPHWAVGTPMHGDDARDAVHVAALDEGVAIGACVLFPVAYPHRELPAAWQLRGMATAEGRRSSGIGSAVLDGAVTTVLDRGGQALWCKARAVAVTFYERNGFTVDTEEYVEPQTGLPHRDMYRLL